MNNGRYFLHEHPLSASSWKLPAMLELIATPGVRRVRGDMCAHGMILKDRQGFAPVFKPTGWCSNSQHVLNHMHKLCDRTHRHASLQNGLAKHAAIYPKRLCLAILRGIKDQLVSDGLSGLNGLHGVGTVNEEMSYSEEMSDRSRFIDDVSGQPLDTKLVEAARLDEVKGIRQHNVWTVVPISECYEKTGRAPVGGRWVDVNKGDEKTPDYRSRYVGREFKGKDNRDDLFAATPPLEAIKALVSLAASQCKNKNIKKLAFIDIKKAYFHAPA